MDDARYEQYAAWRIEAVRQCRIAAEPPLASRLPSTVDVAAIRSRLGQVLFGKPVTQATFARQFGFSTAAVRDWEQGRRKPNAAARVLLLAISANADAVDAALQASLGGEQNSGPKNPAT